MRHMTSRLGLTLVLIGCQSDHSAPRPSDPAAQEVPVAQCDWRSALAMTDVPPTSPPCAIEFREALRLEGDLDGVIPSDPITVLADGSFLTATYGQGRLAR